MYKIKNKIIPSIIISICIFIMNPNNIYAKASYTMTEQEPGSTDIINLNHRIDNVNEYDNIIICSYGCSENNIGTNGGQCGSENSSFNTISYYVKNSPIIKWQIEMNMYQEISSMQQGGDKKSKLNFVWNGSGNAIPSGEIYFESPTSGNKNETWEKTNAYKNLQNSFECPQYLYYDLSLGNLDRSDFKTKYNSFWNSNDDELVLKNGNNMEICYADSGLCETRAEKDKTVFKNKNKLNYSFTEELNKILDSVNNDITSPAASDFLLRYYTSEEDICTAFKSNNGESFVDTLADENMINYINQSLKNHSSNSINSQLYTYEVINKINKDISNLSYEGRSLNEKINNLNTNYKNKFDESVDFYAKKCNVPDNVAEEFKKEASEAMTNKITKQTKNLYDDFDRLSTEELDCDNLFSDVADLISGAYFIIEILGVILLIALTVLDYAKVLLSDNKDDMKKSNQKLIKRVIILIVLLLLPALVNLILGVFNIKGFNSDNPLCVEIKK